MVLGISSSEIRNRESESERGDVILKTTATDGGNVLKKSFSMAISLFYFILFYFILFIYLF